MASDPEVLPDRPDPAAPVVPTGGSSARSRRNPDWQPWVPLLIVPIVLPLITTIFNRAEPKLWGFPAFYWIQLAYVFLSAACTGIVYATSTSRRR
jgi:hypothetical protein